MSEIKDIIISDSNADTHLDYLIKRWSKIASAIYLVTSFIKDNDQIKWNIRNRALSILSLLSDLNGNSEERHVVLDACFQQIKLLVLEMELAHSSHLIGEMNNAVIVSEIASYNKEVEEFKLKNSLLSPIQPEFMKIEKPTYFSAENRISLIGQDIGHSKGQFKKTNTKQEKSLKDNTQSSPSHESKNSERKEKIVRIVKEKGTVSIKDIAASLTGLSEKTIQRELARLVLEGVLDKKGDRRWSTYSLKTAY